MIRFGPYCLPISDLWHCKPYCFYHLGLEIQYGQHFRSILIFPSKHHHYSLAPILSFMVIYSLLFFIVLSAKHTYLNTHTLMKSYGMCFFLNILSIRLISVTWSGKLFFHFHCCKELCYVNSLTFIFQFYCWWTFDNWLHILAFMTNAPINIFVHVSACTCACIFVGYIFRNCRVCFVLVF